LLFFFSSRRRHTRLQGDWSSDVCSSDLTRFETAYERRSQGFEVNDLGFLRQADQQSWYTWFAFQSRHPGSFYQTAFWNFNWKQYWTAAGTPVERAANTNVHVQLNNRWWLHAGTWAGQLATHYCAP